MIAGQVTDAIPEVSSVYVATLAATDCPYTDGFGVIVMVPVGGTLSIFSQTVAVSPR